MKINPYGFGRVTGYSQQTNKVKPQGTEQAAKGDRVEISASAKERQQISSFSAERQARVQELKQQIENGSYEINYSKVAKSMVQFYKK